MVMVHIKSSKSRAIEYYLTWCVYLVKYANNRKNEVLDKVRNTQIDK